MKGARDVRRTDRSNHETPEPDAPTPSLEVGPADDRFEREADRVADRVMQVLRSTGPTEQGGGSRVRRNTRIDRASAPEVGPEGGGVSAETERRIQRMQGGGSTLDEGTRDHFEGAFGGADFGAVRIHTGHEANDLNHRLQSTAFTAGSDILLRDGAYRPESRDGQRLLSHELTHVVQQGESGATLGRVARTTGRDARVIRRALDPKHPDQWPDHGLIVEIMTGGSANLALFKISEGNSSVVAKFTMEDPRRGGFAEHVLQSVGIENSTTNALPMANAGGVIAHIRAAANGQPHGQAVEAKLAGAGGATFVALMKYVGGGDFVNVLAGHFETLESQKPVAPNTPPHKLTSHAAKIAYYVQEIAKKEAILIDPPDETARAQAQHDKEMLEKGLAEERSVAARDQAHLQASGWEANGVPGTIDFAKFASPRFLSDLGKLMVADALVGNSDRLSITTLQEGDDAATIINDANFKVLATDAVGAIDNDTMLFSREFLGQGLTAKAARRAEKAPALPSVSNWAEVVVHGSYDPTEVDPGAIRPTQGVVAALGQIAAGGAQLVQAALAASGGDRGGGMLDPDALAVSVAYIASREQSRGNLADDAAHTAALKAAKAAGLGSSTGAAEAQVHQAALTALIGFDQSVRDFPLRSDRGLFGKAASKMSKKSDDSGTAEQAKEWARVGHNQTIAQIDQQRAVVDGLQDVDPQRKVKAQWELAHRKLCVDINNKVEATRKADTDLRRLVLELQASDVKPGWAMPLMNHARQVATDLEGDVLETYRDAVFHEGESVKQKVGKKESKGSLAETWTLFEGLIQKIRVFRQHVDAAHASVTQIN